MPAPRDARAATPPAVPGAVPEAELAAEFDALTGLAGITVPADLKGGVLRGYRGLRSMAALLRAEIEAGRPPSSVRGAASD